MFSGLSDVCYDQLTIILSATDIDSYQLVQSFLERLGIELLSQRQLSNRIGFLIELLSQLSTAVKSLASAVI